MAKKVLLLISALCLVIASGVAVGARDTARKDISRGATETGPARASSPDQHGSPTGHLPGKQNNFELLSRLRLTDIDDGIADVHYYKGYAYLAAWSPECPNGGTHVVDVRDQHNPEKVAFLPAGAHDYVGEGIHAIHVENRHFRGDILLVNHEPCDVDGRAGISLWDITDPTDPWPIARHVGDFDVWGQPFANSVHSVMGFTQDGGRKAYAVLVDNDEQGSTDVDIMDITDPGQPQLVSETGLPDWPSVEVDANGSNAFHHDMWFKRVNGIDVLAVSYWDAGWVYLNVEDPANPTVLYDTDYPESDLLGFTPPEGNAHQGEWSRDGQYWLGTDEDFSPYRSDFDILTGPNAGDSEGGEFGWTVPIVQNFEDQKAEGTTVWGGSGCPEDVNNNGTPDNEEVPDAADFDQHYSEGEERVLVVTRGTCFFSQKVEAGELAGWDFVLVGNHHAGSGAGEFPDAYFCGGLGHEYTPTISAGCIGHQDMHLLFNDVPTYGDQPHEGSDLPAIGTVGEVASMTSTFDGWGYLNLYDYDTGEYIDSYATPQALNEERAFGWGTMSIHEIATDPRPGSNLGFISWYTVGLKAVRWSSKGIQSTGTYRNVGGNEFWGVSLERRGNEKAPLIYMSDMDSGLWVFKYTGPGS